MDAQHFRTPVELPLQLDRSAEAPLPVQLAAALREAIDAGTLRPGEGVPATRTLALRLGIARGVVVSAYEQLIAEGYLFAERGRGTRVHPGLGASASPTSPVGRAVGRSAGRSAGDSATTGREAAEAPAERSASAHASEPLPPVTSPAPLAPGLPITDAVDGPAWRAAWRAAAARAHLSAPPLGTPRLRSEIADHLRRMRGTSRAPSDVLITAGTRDGLGLLLTALGSASGRRLTVGVEDPGLPSLRGVAARHGAQILALPADEEGLDTSRLPEGLLDVVIVTPSHQYPMGGTLPLARRRELIAWASRTGAVLVEDDFDSELRYTGSPLPALAALDDPVSGSVVMLGTFSRTLAPALSAGYLLAPERLRAFIEPLRCELGGPVSTVVQEALARYLASGELRRHTARMLRRYAARRDAVSDRLAGLAGVRVRPMDGGLHAVIEFAGAPAGELRKRERAAVAKAETAGLGVQALARYWQRPERAAGMAGLVIGMGGSSDAEFSAALQALRGILAALAA